MNDPIFMFPAFGCDESIFANLKFDNMEKRPAQYLRPERDETIEHYARRLIHSNGIGEGASLIGVSFGGIMAVEIAKQVSAQRIILISSIKTKFEKPVLLKFARRSGMHKLISGKMMKRGVFLLRPFFGKNVEGYLNFRGMLRNSDDQLLEWAAHQAAHWENETVIPNILHIHGNKDPLFPIRNIKNAICVENGTHVMVTQKSLEINRIINEEINRAF